MDARVVFIDDDPLCLAGLSRSVRTALAGLHLDFCSSAADALRILSRGSHAVVVCDWTMEGVDGPTFCELVRAAQVEQNPRPYILMLTGRTGTENIVEALERGADDFLSKPVETRELVARIRVGLRLITAEQKLRELNRQLECMAGTDPLTGLLNRRAGERVIETEFARVERGHHDVGICMIDVDHFKQVNDVYGHPIGDRVLVEVAAAVRASTRSYDSVVRWGGEEFIVVCPDIDPADLAAAAGRLLDAIGCLAVEVDPELKVRVTASLGSVWVSAGTRAAAQAAVSAADAALLEAKRQGRARAVAALPIPGEKGRKAPESAQAAAPPLRSE